MENQSHCSPEPSKGWWREKGEKKERGKKVILKEQKVMSKTKQGDKKKKVRVWVDVCQYHKIIWHKNFTGCFDMMHYGHSNALRQAKAMGDYLIVGVHSDAEIAKHKGPTVMKEKERYAAVRACKWVDEVVEDAPYFTTVEILDQNNCDFCIHGDDITTMADGTDCYKAVKEAHRYKECKRTQGVSTTDLVGRMLLMTKEHHKRQSSNSQIAHFTPEELETFRSSNTTKSPGTGISHFLPTSKKIVQFSDDREPKPGDKVVYVCGDFDLFHIGHIHFLEKAKALGDYLLVGVMDDQTVNSMKGSNYPIMNLHERVLSVLACRYVDEVIIGAPAQVTEDVLEKVYSVSIVANIGSVEETSNEDRFKLAKEKGIFVEIEGEGKEPPTSEFIINRIIESRKAFEARNKRKRGVEKELHSKFGKNQDI